MITFPWITTLTMVPVVGAIVLLALGGRNKVLVRWIALAFSLVALILTLVLWHKFNTVADGFQFQELHTGFHRSMLNIESESMASGF